MSPRGSWPMRGVRTSLPVLLRRNASVLDPRTISGLAAWWDASVGITQHASGGVSAWADQSGNGRTMSQGTPNSAPAWDQNVLNGRPVVNFNGSSNSMLASFTLVQPIHYFLVYRFDSAYVSGNPRVFDGATGNSMSFYASSASGMGIFAGAGSDPAISNEQRTAFSVTEIQAASSVAAMRINGSSVSFLSTNAIGAGSPNGMRLGAFGTGSTAYGDVSFAEILIYSAILATGDASSVRSYLGTKYGIAIA